MIYLVIAIVIILMVFFIAKRQKKRGVIIDNDEYNNLKNSSLELAIIKDKYSNLEQNFNNLSQKYEILNKENNTLSSNLAVSQAQNQLITKSYDDILNKYANNQEQLKLEFSSLASKIFEEKSQKFIELNNQNLSPLFSNINQNIENLRNQASKQLEQETRQRSNIENYIAKMIDQTNQISMEANNLTNALKTQVKYQGNWGEAILEGIMQNCGLMENIHYKKQLSYRDEAGNQLRPDFIINLPKSDEKESGIIVIDSKLSLIAFEKYSISNNNEEQKLALKDHINSIKRHIDSLAEKQYHNIDNSAITMTIAFIPIENAYLLAIQNDQQLWSYGYQKKILLVSPTNFIACLKIINDLWIRQEQNKNAYKIVDRATKLYEKLITFCEYFKKVGDNIKQTSTNYDEAIKIFSHGKGNIASQIENLRKLGLDSNKRVNKELLDTENNQDEDDKEEL
jgi:DNA recombination protein RmuC